ncbi:efflux RND transporter permease subunit [Pseudoalteromonas denitrificans]|uniref:Hydrophobic/amphiphilic exporter-1, HAE1 family n=1 Tax=Pseudoalteromonas denitrificans DSM 6059 TaxID=1123010 RepID=A0A1I1NAC1_9GAMM|nr:efflux RND transporter permease subunit [Pseudoalteromonas denitrificans]SFC94527.1 hydrophobic/amphiphilic exporter-1, HAE1 family [Pseudoalteromonas denitrificans DSM 6059]
MILKHFFSKKASSVIIGLTFLICLFGIFMGLKLPNALLPPIDRPEIELFMAWPGKSALEIEQTLIAPLEESLERINNLIELRADIGSGSAQMLLRFKSKTDMQQTYIDVLAGVNQVPTWPSEVPRPFIVNNADGTNTTLATAMLYAKNPASKDEVIKAFKKVVEPTLGKLDGISSLIPAGNPPQQRIDIEFNVQKLSDYSLELNKIIETLNNLSDGSGDTLILGNREYSLHFKGKMNSKELANLPIHHIGQHIIRLKDIAQIHKRLDSQWSYSSINGHYALYFMLQPSKGVNALATVKQVKQVIEALNQNQLKNLDMKLVLSRDDSKDIINAIEQVYMALLLGIFLSGLILYFFLKEIKKVSLIFISIPVCLALVLIAMNVFGFSLNVISLAGLALSVGLLLDAAIVVIDSILAYQKQGYQLNDAIVKGTLEVSSAIFSSTISSIIIFIPILLIDSTQSQLFEDLAFTISSALFASLIVALVILPAFCRYMLISQLKPKQKKKSQLSHILCFSARSKKVALIVLVTCIPLALFVSVFAMPDIDVLPDPKQRSINTFISFNEPLSPEAVESGIAQVMIQRIEQQKSNENAPKYDVTGMFCGDDYCLLYFYPKAGWDYNNFKTWVETHITQDLAGTDIFSQQGSLLRFALPNSRTTQLDVQGDELSILQDAGQHILNELKTVFPDANIRQSTPLENQSARVEFTPKYEQLVYYGMTTHTLNRQLLVLTQGVYLGRFFDLGDSYPLYLKAQDPSNINQLLNTEIYIPDFGLRPLSEIVSAELSLSPNALLRINKSATISIALTPPQNMTVGVFSKKVDSELKSILAKSEYQHLNMSFRGSVDELGIFIKSFLQMFAFSVLILLFLLWLSLNSWKLAFAVMLSMPLSFAGGMLFLQLLNLFVNQALDVITMIGFIILLGLVINNAILLATKFQTGINNNLSQYQAIFDAVESRKRPIYMSTATSIFGMLPLMLLPGEGAEIYRGLAAVIIGGMTFSAVLSLSFMAALLSLPIFSTSKVNQTSKNEQKTNGFLVSD